MASPFQDDDLAADDRLVIVIGEDAPPRLDKALAAAVPEQAALSRSRLMKMICEGDVLSGGVAVTDPKTKVKEGDSFTLLLAPPVDVATLPEDIPLTVVWEDGDLIVIDKPAGMVVHPGAGFKGETLASALLYHFKDIYVVFYLEGPINEDKAARAAQLSFEKYCSVSKTLEPTATIHYKVVLNGVELAK